MYNENMQASDEYWADEHETFVDVSVHKAPKEPKEPKESLEPTPLQTIIEWIAKPYLENCAGLGRDAYNRIDMFAKALASNIIKEIEHQALTTKQT